MTTTFTFTCLSIHVNVVLQKRLWRLPYFSWDQMRSWSYFKLIWDGYHYNGCIYDYLRQDHDFLLCSHDNPWTVSETWAHLRSNCFILGHVSSQVTNMCSSDPVLFFGFFSRHTFLLRLSLFFLFFQPMFLVIHLLFSITPTAYSTIHLLHYKLWAWGYYLPILWWYRRWATSTLVEAWVTTGRKGTKLPFR